MCNDIPALLEESIHVELNVSSLYQKFYELFPDDADFWWTLMLEEKNHAALLRSGKESFEPLNLFPSKLIHDKLHDLKEINTALLSLIDGVEKKPPSREEAFNIAFNMENSAGEVHFQRFMEAEGSSVEDKIFKELNEGDKEHAERIRSYMEKQGIRLYPDD